MSKIETFVNLQNIQTLEDLLRTNWMDLTELTAMGNRRPYFIPDCEMVGLQTEHHRVKIVKATTALQHRLNLRRVEELSDFPDSPVLLTGYKGELYVKPKAPRSPYYYASSTDTRQ